MIKTILRKLCENTPVILYFLLYVFIYLFFIFCDSLNLLDNAVENISQKESSNNESHKRINNVI